MFLLARSFCNSSFSNSIFPLVIWLKVIPSGDRLGCGGGDGVGVGVGVLCRGWGSGDGEGVCCPVGGYGERRERDSLSVKAS